MQRKFTLQTISVNLTFEFTSFDYSLFILHFEKQNNLVNYAEN